MLSKGHEAHRALSTGQLVEDKRHLRLGRIDVVIIGIGIGAHGLEDKVSLVGGNGLLRHLLHHGCVR
jgi:hypothetical protein